MIQYALPDFNTKLSYNLMFAGMMRTAPEMFFEDVIAECIYGCFPDCIMNGGRVMKGERAGRGRIAETFDAIEKEGLGIRLTFTNMLVRPEHFEDEYANDILREASGRNARVIVWSDELGEYISAKYKLGLILSTTRVLDGAEEVNAMLARYDMVVLDYNRNKDDDFLRQISDPSRLEVMVNERCVPHCAFRREHHLQDSISQMEHAPSAFRCKGRCEGSGFTSRTAASPTIMGNDDIRRMNSTYGVTHFKLSGRNAGLGHFTESYLYYFVRPEYRGLVSKIIGRRFGVTEDG